MENASKALLMAGGVLIGLLILAALMLMVNQISSYNKTKNVSKEVTQISKFNKEFTKYTDSDIKGYDLVSLANKVVDFNEKDSGADAVDYSKTMTLFIDMGNFQDKAVNANMLSANTYTITTTNANNFYTDINTCQRYESTYTLNTMSKLSSNYDKIIKDENGNVRDDQEQQKEIKKIVGSSYIDGDLDMYKIKNYRTYSEFKSSTFRSVESGMKYDNGQLIELSFIYVK